MILRGDFESINGWHRGFSSRWELPPIVGLAMGG